MIEVRKQGYKLSRDRIQNILNPEFDGYNVDDVEGMILARECLINYPKKPMVHEIRQADA